MVSEPFPTCFNFSSFVPSLSLPFCTTHTNCVEFRTQTLAHRSISFPSFIMSTSADIEIPEEFLCPISLSVMKEPVMSKDGKNFEKAAILDWLNRGNTECPLTRKLLKPSLLVPNNNLKMAIYTWKKTHGLVDDDEHDNDSDAHDHSRGFVGVLHMKDQPALMGDYDDDDDTSSSLHERDPQSLSLTTPQLSDDELRNILDLFNEVLDLTSLPLDELAAQATTSTTESSTITAQSVNAMVSSSRASRRRWRPKFFGKHYNRGGRATTASSVASSSSSS